MPATTAQNGPLTGYVLTPSGRVCVMGKRIVSAYATAQETLLASDLQVRNAKTAAELVKDFLGRPYLDAKQAPTCPCRCSR